MTKEEFVELCRELLELGAVDVQGGVYRATFRPQQQQHGPIARKAEPQEPARRLSPDEARRAHYARVMGDDPDR